jgi:hypothetical protein
LVISDKHLKEHKFSELESSQKSYIQIENYLDDIFNQFFEEIFAVGVKHCSNLLIPRFIPTVLQHLASFISNSQFLGNSCVQWRSSICVFVVYYHESDNGRTDFFTRVFFNRDKGDPRFNNAQGICLFSKGFLLYSTLSLEETKNIFRFCYRLRLFDRTTSSPEYSRTQTVYNPKEADNLNPRIIYLIAEGDEIICLLLPHNEESQWAVELRFMVLKKVMKSIQRSPELGALKNSLSNPRVVTESAYFAPFWESSQSVFYFIHFRESTGVYLFPPSNPPKEWMTIFRHFIEVCVRIREILLTMQPEKTKNYVEMSMHFVPQGGIFQGLVGPYSITGYSIFFNFRFLFIIFRRKYQQGEFFVCHGDDISEVEIESAFSYPFYSNSELLRKKISRNKI